jgi:hypothetical protein
MFCKENHYSLDNFGGTVLPNPSLVRFDNFGAGIGGTELI